MRPRTGAEDTPRGGRNQAVATPDGVGVPDAATRRPHLYHDPFDLDISENERVRSDN
ncbi:hypothetical protein GCM10009544_43830 [Streptomyces stramineus]|uniref:Uncharacterized protein n=1 Tax=Streptomyces stramineus TaxID=173861 RepID=A0ABN1AI38_9ACTN